MKKNDFGKKLIEVRKAKGLTQEEIAEKSNITVRTIQRIESGVVQPRASTIKIISEVLDFDFFSKSNYSFEVIKSNLKLNNYKVLWYLKDLFNLKTNTMKKVSILSTSLVIVGLVLSVFISESNAQAENPKSNNSINIQRNEDNSIKRIEVSFTNNLTFDSLVQIKKEMDLLGITLNYKKIELDSNNQLLEIACDVDTNDGFSGGFAIGFLNSSNKDRKFGFYRDYSKNAKSSFGTGTLIPWDMYPD